MHQDDQVSKNIQRLWSTYDTVVSSDCVKRELRLLQVKNSRRIATHPEHTNLPAANAPSALQLDRESDVPSRKSPNPFDPSAISFESVRFEGTAVMSSFQRTAATDRYMEGKSMFDLIKDRQATMKEADRCTGDLGSNEN